MGQSRQSVQRLSNEMLADGLLVSHDNPDHKRAKLFTLTDFGRDTYKKAMQSQIPWVNDIAEDLSSEELDVVSAVLRKLIHRFE